MLQRCIGHGRRRERPEHQRPAVPAAVAAGGGLLRVYAKLGCSSRTFNARASGLGPALDSGQALRRLSAGAV